MKWKSQLIACSSLPRCSLASMPSHSGNLLHRDSNHLDSAGSELDHDVDDYDCNTACCRWDCEQTRQVWTACSTIQIEPKPWRKLNSGNKRQNAWNEVDLLPQVNLSAKNELTKFGQWWQQLHWLEMLIIFTNLTKVDTVISTDQLGTHIEGFPDICAFGK